jgi:hypothetical protein
LAIGNCQLTISYWLITLAICYVDINYMSIGD